MSQLHSFQSQMSMRRVVMSFIADALFVYPFKLGAYFEKHRENFLILSTFLREFYIRFVLRGKRLKSNSWCRKGIDCFDLYVHAFLEKLCEVAQTKRHPQLPDIPTFPSSGEVVEIADSAPKVAFSDNCHGYHTDLHRQAVFADVNRQFEHPFFTKEMCRTTIDVIIQALEEYGAPEVESIELLIAGQLKRCHLPHLGRIRQREETEDAPVGEPLEVTRPCSPEPRLIPDNENVRFETVDA